MGFSNNMTKLLNKIENRLGVKLLNLPKEIAKPTWATEVIIPDTLTTFSRFFPNEVEYEVTKQSPKKDGIYFIDEDFINGVEILGVKDIDWTSFTNNTAYYAQELGLGYVDYLSSRAGIGVEDIGLLQMKKDISSLFNNNIFLDYLPPNKIKLTSATNSNIGANFGKFRVKLLIKHADSLITISPTMFETFESLAISDVAGYLYRNLKYFDGLETVYSTIDLKLSELEEQMSKRQDIIEQLRDASVSASNNSCPIIMTV